MRWLIVVVAMALCGCASAVHVVKWRPQERALVLGVDLGLASNPNDGQVRQAMAVAAAHCGDGKYKVVEEGTTVSQGVAVGLYGGGTVDEKHYYYVIGCDALATEGAAVDAGPRS